VTQSVDHLAAATLGDMPRGVKRSRAAGVMVLCFYDDRRYVCGLSVTTAAAGRVVQMESMVTVWLAKAVRVQRWR
jgi:hypothetical protein